MYSSSQDYSVKPPPPPATPPPPAPPPATPPPSAPPLLPYSYGQPPVTGIPIPGSLSPAFWSTGLCDCFSDFSNCCLTCWCPCITFGQIAEIVDKGSPSCCISGTLCALLALTTGCCCIYSCIYRSRMRGQYKLAGNPCGDCLVHCCCESCALCQEHRELRVRGFDMSLGWRGNVERQNGGGVGMAPIPLGGMSR